MERKGGAVGELSTEGEGKSVRKEEKKRKQREKQTTVHMEDRFSS